MRNDIRVRVTGIQNGDEDTKSEVSAKGTYRKIGERHFIKYHDDSLPGAGADVLLQFEDGHFEMSKRGDISMRLIFEEGKTFKEKMALPYGSFIVEVETRKLTVSVNDTDTRAEIDYLLKIGEEQVSRTHLVMEAWAE